MLNNIFIDHGYIHNDRIEVNHEVEMSNLNDGINQFNEFVVLKKKNDYKIFNRNCDHAGGRLIKSQNSSNLYCPVHNWVFNPEKGKYSNGVQKEEIKYDIKNNKLLFSIDKLKPKIKTVNKKSGVKISIKYFNHAFLIIEGKNFKFATDPWAIGPAFNNGWWLNDKTEADWLEEVNSCDFIYISHNHPDHLNHHTLKKVSKNKTIIIPKFQHDSIGGMLKKLKFKNLIYLEINKQYQFKKSNLIICILKSGDFRLDSGIYFSIGEFSSLIDVDANAINFFRLPEVTLYATSYKGGASGYPLMFDNYGIIEKRKIIKTKNNFLKNIKIKNILKLKAKYFLPYASAFSENLQRDKFVKNNNKKIRLNEYSKILKKKNVEVLDTNIFKKFNFEDQKLISKNAKSNKIYPDQKPLEYLKKFKSSNSKIEINKIKKYFIKSNYQDNLILNISLTNDNFLKDYEKFSINFNSQKPLFHKGYMNEFENKNGKKIRILNLKIRKEVFINTIKNKMPWEDMLIGFQCRVSRKPNIFNSNFWYYFSNIYINNSQKKSISECNSCELFTQKVDSLIYHSSQ